jgi:hypothetical protein
MNLTVGTPASIEFGRFQIVPHPSGGQIKPRHAI